MEDLLIKPGSLSSRQEPLRESAEKYCDFFGEASDGVALMSTDGASLSVNRAFALMHGYSTTEEMRHLRLTDFDTAETARLAPERLHRLLAGESLNFDVEHYRRDGSKFFLNVSCKTVQIEGKSYFLGLHRDITERIRAAEALERSEEKYRKLIEMTRTGFVILDFHGRVVDANAEYVRMTGWSELADIRGKAVTEWTAPHDAQRNAAEVARCLRGEQVNGLQVYYIDAKGRTTPVEISATMEGAGDTLRIFSICRDITERIQAEEAMRRVRTLESLGTAAGGIAHDFNNLLMGVFGNMELARLDLPPGHPSLVPLMAADQALDNARQLTTRLLTFARGGNPVLETVDLRQRIRATVQFHLAGSRVAARFDVPEDLWPLRADSGQIAEVISNLTVNSVEAMPAGGTIRVHASNVTDVRGDAASGLHGDYVKIVFSDDGAGIPPNLVGRIFDPYFTTKKAGSGLGLAIVHGIVNRHKGHIKVESVPGAGTTFTVWLPAEKSALCSLETAPPAALGAQPIVSGRVLLMDDEELVRTTTARMLARCGCTVETAVDGAEAISRYAAALKRGTPFDLTIMDLTVPGGKGGKEAIGDLLSLDPRARAVVSSGYSSDPVLSDFTRFGFSGRLVKPFSLEDLIAVVSRFLKAL